MASLASATGLSVQSGKMVAELRPAGADKGDAVRAFMAEPPFAGARPVFVGDDLTDEDAFCAAADLGGGGVLVGPARDSAARWRLPGVAAVAEWSARLGRPMSDLNLWPIGNCQVSALVDSEAALVWACAPQVDGDPLFCALLSPKGEGDRGCGGSGWRTRSRPSSNICATPRSW
jgi:hypothetical protein